MTMPALKLVQTTIAALATSAVLATPAFAAEPDHDLAATTASTTTTASSTVEGREAGYLIAPDDTRAEIRKARKHAIKEAKRTDRNRGGTVLDVAASKAGAPYVYGGTGPSVFDCSGFTRWVYAHVGKSLPHSSAAQVGYTTRVSAPAPGDLAFFYGSGGVYHVAIYAGNHQVWHAPNPGRGVSKETIWTGAVFYGRVN